jgi:hypothetical protein
MSRYVCHITTWGNFHHITTTGWCVTLMSMHAPPQPASRKVHVNTGSFLLPLARRTPTTLLFPYREICTHNNPHGIPSLHLGYRNSHFRESNGRALDSRIPESRYSQHWPFPSPLGIFPIAILTLAMSNNLFYRLSNLDMPKLWYTRALWLFNGPSLHRHFRVHNITNPDAKSLGLHFSRTLIWCHLSTRWLLWPHTVLLYVRLLGIVISRFSFPSLRDYYLRKLDMEIHEKIQLSLWLGSMVLPLLSFEPFGNTRRISPAPLWDLTLTEIREPFSENTNSPLRLDDFCE